MNNQELANSVVHRYLTLTRYQRYRSDQVYKQTNATGRQLGILRFLVQNGPRTVGQVSQFLYVRDATTSGLLDRMERDGLVTRRRSSQDNRKVFVEPTDAGREIVLQAPLGMVAILRERLPELSAQDLERIDQALAKLSDIAGVDESVLE